MFHPALYRHPGRRRWHSLIIAIMLANAVSACTTIMRFDRFDGRSDAGAAAQFQQDDAIYKGEVAKPSSFAAS